MRLDEAARRYVGVKFRHQGRNPKSGLDCIGLLKLAAIACGLPQAAGDALDYGKDPHDGLLEGRLRILFGPPLPFSQARPGDIPAIDFKGAIRHVGVIGEHPNGLSLIHTSTSTKFVTEHLIDFKWARRIAGIYRPGAV